MKKIITIICIVATIVALVGVRYTDNKTDGYWTGDGIGHYTQERSLSFYGTIIWSDTNVVEVENVAFGEFLKIMG